ncbi:sialic acid-binding Ig-like lectin 9 [Lacerta agilis]|uniref:sialic acid-binding Ig-like lectin 9 n=1 Tax=Lacerta agilis TaxID=80427 RepID=UPI0014191F2C|nr:sialic acid-binding Ig-like lectin 9 [Lacerta agilis]
MQRGLCVHIPCNFTYPTSEDLYPAKLYVYWIKNDYVESYIRNTRHEIMGSIVATSDKAQSIASFAGNRFQLTGNASEGDCSFSINDVQNQDAGQYYFRIEKGQIKFSYRYSYILPVVSVTGGQGQKHTWMEPQARGVGREVRWEWTAPEVIAEGGDIRTPVSCSLVTLVCEFSSDPILGTFVFSELTEKPKILNSPEVVLGKSVTLICQAPGTCPWKESWSQPQISWSTRSSTITAQNHQHSNGSWTFASGFTFTPSLQVQGRALTCSVRYPAVGRTVENKIHLEVVYPPQDIRITRPGHPGEIQNS